MRRCFRNRSKTLRISRIAPLPTLPARTMLRRWRPRCLSKPRQHSPWWVSRWAVVALEIMRRAPERVLALALISTSAYPSTSAEAANCLSVMTKAEDNFQIVLDQMMPTLLHPSRMEYHSNVTTDYSMGHRTGKDAFIRQQCATMNRIDGRPFLLGIACPTLVLCGNDDVLVPAELQVELAAGIPAADLKIIADAAHFLTIGKPDEVSTLLRSWLARVVAQRLTAATWQCPTTA